MLRIIHVTNCIVIRREENPDFNPAELMRRFTYRNPKYYKNKRLGFSNYGVPREICLADLHTEYLTLPRGLVSEILKLYPDVAIIDETAVNPVNFESSKIMLKDFQGHVIDTLLNKNQGVLVSPPGSGKTIIGIELIGRRAQKTLVLVHTLDLLYQWQERFRDLTDIESGVIQGDRIEIRNVTVGMTQSLCRPLDDAFTAQFGMILLDECHHVPAATFRQLIDQFPARYRYGLSATPERQDGLEFIMAAVIGNILHEVRPSFLIVNGSILKPKVKVVQTSMYLPIVESYTELLARIIKDKDRNRLIVDLVMKEAKAGHYCLILSERVRHAQELHRMFMENNPNISAFVITGKDSKETRQRAIDAINQGTGKVLFSTKLADEGLDIQRLDRLFLTCPVRAVNKVTQQIGRIQRTFPCKHDAIVYDFLDINSLAESQFRTRERRIYSEYEVEFGEEEKQYERQNNKKTA